MASKSIEEKLCICVRAVLRYDKKDTACTRSHAPLYTVSYYVNGSRLLGQTICQRLGKMLIFPLCFRYIVKNETHPKIMILLNLTISDLINK